MLRERAVRRRTRWSGASNVAVGRHEPRDAVVAAAGQGARGLDELREQHGTRRRLREQRQQSAVGFASVRPGLRGGTGESSAHLQGREGARSDALTVACLSACGYPRGRWRQEQLGPFRPPAAADSACVNAA